MLLRPSSLAITLRRVYRPHENCFATSPSSQMLMASNMTRTRNSYLNHSASDACLKGESAIMVTRESAGAPEGHREDFVFELQNQCWVLLTRLHAPNVGIASIVRSDGMDEHEACESANLRHFLLWHQT